MFPLYLLLSFCRCCLDPLSNPRLIHNNEHRTKRERDDLKETQSLLVAPEEVEKERETVISCRQEILRLEVKLRLLGQRYTMLKAAVDSAFRKYFNYADLSTPASPAGELVAAASSQVDAASGLTSSQKKKGKATSSRGRRRQGLAAHSMSGKEEEEDDIKPVPPPAPPAPLGSQAPFAAQLLEEDTDFDVADVQRRLQMYKANADAQVTEMTGCSYDCDCVTVAVADCVWLQLLL